MIEWRSLCEIVDDILDRIVVRIIWANVWREFEDLDRLDSASFSGVLDFG
jgi:hypothetical protein